MTHSYNKDTREERSENSNLHQEHSPIDYYEIAIFSYLYSLGVAAWAIFDVPGSRSPAKPNQLFVIQRPIHSKNFAKICQ